MSVLDQLKRATHILNDAIQDLIAVEKHEQAKGPSR